MSRGGPAGDFRGLWIGILRQQLPIESSMLRARRRLRSTGLARHVGRAVAFGVALWVSYYAAFTLVVWRAHTIIQSDYLAQAGSTPRPSGGAWPMAAWLTPCFDEPGWSSTFYKERYPAWTTPSFMMWVEGVPGPVRILPRFGMTSGYPEHHHEVIFLTLACVGLGVFFVRRFGWRLAGFPRDDGSRSSFVRQRWAILVRDPHPRWDIWLGAAVVGGFAVACVGDLSASITAPLVEEVTWYRELAVSMSHPLAYSDGYSRGEIGTLALPDALLMALWAAAVPCALTITSARARIRSDAVSRRTRCWRCGYPARKNFDGTPCSECGSLPVGCPHATRGRRRWWAVVALTVALGAAALVIAPYVAHEMRNLLSDPKPAW